MATRTDEKTKRRHRNYSTHHPDSYSIGLGVMELHSDLEHVCVWVRQKDQNVGKRGSESRGKESKEKRRPIDLDPHQIRWRKLFFSPSGIVQVLATLTEAPESTIWRSTGVVEATGVDEAILAAERAPGAFLRAAAP